jgi:hypothetical protein
MHGVLYFERFLEDPGAKWMWTGAGALLCGLIIFVTSTDYIRRNHFNVFFFSVGKLAFLCFFLRFVSR